MCNSKALHRGSFPFPRSVIWLLWQEEFHLSEENVLSFSAHLYFSASFLEGIHPRSTHMPVVSPLNLTEVFRKDWSVETKCPRAVFLIKNKLLAIASLSCIIYSVICECKCTLQVTIFNYLRCLYASISWLSCCKEIIFQCQARALTLSELGMTTWYLCHVPGNWRCCWSQWCKWLLVGVAEIYE